MPENSLPPAGEFCIPDDIQGVVRLGSLDREDQCGFVCAFRPIATCCRGYRNEWPPVVSGSVRQVLGSVHFEAPKSRAIVCDPAHSAAPQSGKFLVEKVETQTI